MRIPVRFSAGRVADNYYAVTAKLAAFRPLADRPPDEVLDELIAQACAAVLESRRAGGNRAHYVVC